MQYTLSAVRVFNFKTFIGEHSITDIPRLSFIVGPNGSGKTNIYDAILFATLFPDPRVRTSDGYISAGASDGCWVMLTFAVIHQDSEAVEPDHLGTTLSFHRGYQRTGAENFKINGRITTKEAYSAKLKEIGIMDQRQVPSVFYVSSDQLGENIKAQTIIQYIETASGSCEYSEEFNSLSKEYTSLEAKLKAQKTRLNLLSQRKELAKKAEEDNKKYAELNRNRELFFFKRFLLPLLSHKYHCQLIDPRILTTAREISDAETTKSAIQHHLTELHNTSLELTKNITECDAKIASLEKSLKDLERQSANTILTEQQLTIKIKNAHEQQLTYTERKQQREHELVQIDHQLHLVNNDLTELESRIGHSSERQASTSKFFTDDYRRRQEAFSSLKSSELKLINDLKQRYNKQLLHKEQQQKSVDQLKDELRVLQDRHNMLERTQKQHKRALDDASAKIDRCNSEIEQIKQQNKDIDEQKCANLLTLEKLRNQLSMSIQTETTNRREEELRLSLKESQDAFPQDVMGLLKTMVTPIKEEHRQLLHDALGAYQNGVVCSSSLVAQKCIATLKLKMRRPLMFLPTDTLRINDKVIHADRSAAAKFRQAHPGIDIRPFIEIIDVNKVAEKATKFALHNTFYCDSAYESSVAEFAWKDGGGHRVILSNGVQLRPGGIVSCDFGADSFAAATTSSKSNKSKRTKDVPIGASRANMNAVPHSTSKGDKELVALSDEEASLQCAKLTQLQDSLLEQATLNIERLQRLQYTDLINYNNEYKRAEKAWEMGNLQTASLSAKCAAVSNSYEQATKYLDDVTRECERLGDTLCDQEETLWKEKEEYFSDIVADIAAAIKQDSDPSLAKLRRKDKIFLKDLEEEDQQQKEEIVSQFTKLKEAKYSLEMRRQLAGKFDYSEQIERLKKIIKDSTDIRTNTINERRSLDAQIAETRKLINDQSTATKDATMQRTHINDRITLQQGKLGSINSKILQLNAQLTLLQSTLRGIQRDILHLCESALMTNTTLIFDSEQDGLDDSDDRQSKVRGRKKSAVLDATSRCMALFEECQRLLSSSEDDIAEQIANTCNALIALPFSYHLVDPSKQLESAYISALQANESNYAKCVEPLERQYSILEAKLSDLKKALDKEMDSFDDYVGVDTSIDDLDRELSKEAEELKSLHKKRSDTHTLLSAVTEKRRKHFLHCFDFLSKELSPIYYALAYDEASDGSLPAQVASLTLTKRQTPWSTDFIFTVFPPSGYAKAFDELSSGEKSVALLALIFCLHRYKALPFLLLDEVDKNLDSRNVDRLSKYLCREQRIHAIAISHQASMFSNGDLLIGVTRVRAAPGEGAPAGTWHGAEIYLLDMAQYNNGT